MVQARWLSPAMRHLRGVAMRQDVWRQSCVVGVDLTTRYAVLLRAVLRASICAESAALRTARSKFRPRRCQRRTTACDAGASGNAERACRAIAAFNERQQVRQPDA